MSEVQHEQSSDPWGGDYMTVWHVAPPAVDRGFVITHEEWRGSDFGERHIFAWRYADED